MHAKLLFKAKPTSQTTQIPSTWDSPHYKLHLDSLLTAAYKEFFPMISAFDYTKRKKS